MTGLLFGRAARLCGAGILAAAAMAGAGAAERSGRMDAGGEWRSEGGAWARDGGTVRVTTSADAAYVRSEPLGEAFEAAATVLVTAESGERQAGLLFQPAGANSPAYFYGLDAANSRVLFARRAADATAWTLLVIRNAPVKAGTAYRLRLAARGARVQGFFTRVGAKTAKPAWPLFDVDEASFGGGRVVFRATGAAEFRDFAVGAAPPLPKGPTYTNAGGLIPDVADPDVLKVGDTYYAYGTGGHGIRAYVSKDLVHWSKPVGATDGYALAAADSWGARWFWAPEVIPHGGGFRMHYSADEHLAVADAKSPLGPFKQAVKAPMHPDIQEIDSHPFTDDDGKQYLYFVRWDHGGNHVMVAELNADGTNIRQETLKECIFADQPWEHTKVNEGPWVLKHNGVYYLMYSGNGFTDWDYGVGYATAPSPTGPWTKYAYNPVLASNAYIHGAGHHAVTKSPDGKEMFIAYHSHRNTHAVHPRKLAVDRLRFIKNPNGGPDLLEAYGPTLTPQPMPSGTK
jgi:hypothetical protein